MFQFYVPELSADQQQVLITEEEFHHLKNVRRVKIGEVVQLFNGKGLVFKVKIKKFYKDKVETEVLEKYNVPKKTYELVLCQGIIKIDKFEQIVEKVTEIGIDKIIPLKLDYCVVNYDVFLKKYHRFEKIIIESAKQANIVYLPKLVIPQKLDEVFNDKENWLTIVCYKNSKFTLDNFYTEIKKQNKIRVVIGSEGDFSNKEIKFLEQKDVKFVSLGDNILRSETAAVVAVSFITQLKLSNGSIVGEVF
jgi:16S rRNA (uracil1498-N3)-methyltransferase